MSTPKFELENDYQFTKCGIPKLQELSTAARLGAILIEVKGKATGKHRKTHGFNHEAYRISCPIMFTFNKPTEYCLVPLPKMN